MALDAATAQEMLKKLADDQKAYLNTLTLAHDVLSQALNAAATGQTQPKLTTEHVRRNTGATLATVDVESVKKDSKGSTLSVEDDSDTDDDESMFVQQTLPPEKYTEEEFRQHLQSYAWTEAGRAIVRDVLDNEQILRRDTIFPSRTGPVDDKSHLSHFSIFDIGPDGAPLEIMNASEKQPSRALEIWERIRSINADEKKERKSVGRITIVREPSPLLFAALHYTMKDHFDMDEIFHLLVTDTTEILPHRAFSEKKTHRSTFVMTFDYFTIIGEDCVPMRWQKADEELAETEDHIPLSRCSSVVALSLEAKPMGQIRNRNRRVTRKLGDVYDPFSPWHVMSIQAYPDWKSTVHSHDSTKHYVNGPEAFLVTLRAEFKDVQKRLMEVYRSISTLVKTPPDFMFRQAVRDKLLFEDDSFTYSRRYFWAHQSLGVMNEEIQTIINAYRQTFTNDVWNGSDKIIWPGDETTSSRYAFWRKRMRVLRDDIEHEIGGLEDINRLNEEKMKEIKGLRNSLFSGTSVLESRKSVQQQAITVQQGHNIKLLTLVTIFFLPLTFVTSVFGMTNISQQSTFKPFGIVLTIICVPTYMLIGSLNTTSGLQFWTQKTNALFTRIGHGFAVTLNYFGYRPKWTTYAHLSREDEHPDIHPSPLSFSKTRTQSATEGKAARGVYGPVGLDVGRTGSVAISPSPTLERTIRFEPSKPRDTPKPSSINAKTEASSVSIQGRGKKAHASGGWISRLFGGKRISTASSETKDPC